MGRAAWVEGPTPAGRNPHPRTVVCFGAFPLGASYARCREQGTGHVPHSDFSLCRTSNLISEVDAIINPVFLCFSIFFWSLSYANELSMCSHMKIKISTVTKSSVAFRNPQDIPGSLTELLAIRRLPRCEDLVPPAAPPLPSVQPATTPPSQQPWCRRCCKKRRPLAASADVHV